MEKPGALPVPSVCDSATPETASGSGSWRDTDGDPVARNWTGIAEELGVLLIEGLQ